MWIVWFCPDCESVMTLFERVWNMKKIKGTCCYYAIKCLDDRKPSDNTHRNNR